MDEQTGLCQGCYRTLEEIEKWWDMDDATKAAVVKTAAGREAAAFDWSKCNQRKKPAYAGFFISISIFYSA